GGRGVRLARDRDPRLPREQREAARAALRRDPEDRPAAGRRVCECLAGCATVVLPAEGATRTRVALSAAGPTAGRRLCLPPPPTDLTSTRRGALGACDR